MTYAITAPRWSNSVNTSIDVIWDHPRFGPIPFTAVDPSAGVHADEPDYMQEIWDELVAGIHGPIAPYEPPVTE